MQRNQRGQDQTLTVSPRQVSRKEETSETSQSPTGDRSYLLTACLLQIQERGRRQKPKTEIEALVPESIKVNVLKLSE